MTIFGWCGICHRNRFFVRYRKYWTKATGWMRSQEPRCGQCHRRTKATVKAIGSGN